MDKPETTLDEDSAYLCGKLAFEIVRDAGGFVTFDQYDDLIANKFLPYPIGWCAGWGNGMMQHNQKIMAAWKAVDMGLLSQTKDGYKCSEPNPSSSHKIHAPQ